MEALKRKSFLITIIGIIMACIAYNMHDRWKGDWWKSTIHSDGYGYYGYLPAIFILHHFDYDKLIEMEKQAKPDVSDFEAGYSFPTGNGVQADKYFAGVAVLLTPFFLIAYLLSYLFGYDINGYSYLFQLSVSVAAIFYLVLGLWFMRKILRSYGIGELIISITAIVLVLGTNLFYYATIEPSLTHIYSFSMFAVFMWYARKSLIQFTVKDASIAAAVFALLVIIRPTNILDILVLPILAGDISIIKNFFANLLKPKSLVIVLVSGFLTGFIQLLLWYVQTGHFIYWSYVGEGFYFAHPRMMDILFSYRNGWFIYTPVMLLTVIGGSIVLYRKGKLGFTWFIIFFLAITYVMSCWYTWYYAGFGHRGYVEFYALFALLLGLFINELRNRAQVIAVSAITGFCMFLNVMQTRQYTNFIIPATYMDKTMYWQLFLKTNSKYVGAYEKHIPAWLTLDSKLMFTNSFDYNPWYNNNNSITMDEAINGRYSSRVDDKTNDSPVLSVPVSKLQSNAKNYVYIDFWVYIDQPGDASLVVKEGKDAISSIPITDSLKMPKVWREVNFIVPLTNLKSQSDTLNINVHGTKGKAYIDDEKVYFGTAK